MAFTLENLRAKILTSIHGRRLGIDSDGFLVGARQVREPVTNATSATTATALANNGVHTVATTTNDSWTLADPVPGCRVDIMTGSSSTGTHTILPTNATFNSSASSTGGSVVLTGGNAGITLVGVSTALWQAVATRGTTAQAHVST